LRRVTFRLPAAEKEDLLDALMPLLPAGVRERPLASGMVELATLEPPARAVLETAAGRPLEGWHEAAVPADWRARRARLGGGAYAVGGRLLVRSPWDPPAGPGLIDLVLERAGGGFGSGSHPTTRMCLALLLEVAPAGGAADLGCGLGTLAIAAARLGWAPVLGVDRMAGAVDAARANGERNGVTVDWRAADLESAPVPLAALVLVNAPPPVHERLAAALAAASGAGPRAVIASGLVAAELAAVTGRYATAGWVVATALEEAGWTAVRLERAGA
jgi:ribosomal protein L11 methyltransferase